MSEAMRAAASLYNNPRYNSESEIRIQKNKIRRQRIVRRQRVTLALVIAMILFAMIFVVSTLVKFQLLLPSFTAVTGIQPSSASSETALLSAGLLLFPDLARRRLRQKRLPLLFRPQPRKQLKKKRNFLTMVNWSLSSRQLLLHQRIQVLMVL